MYWHIAAAQFFLEKLQQGNKEQYSQDRGAHLLYLTHNLIPSSFTPDNLAGIALK